MPLRRTSRSSASPWGSTIPWRCSICASSRARCAATSGSRCATASRPWRSWWSACPRPSSWRGPAWRWPWAWPFRPVSCQRSAATPPSTTCPPSWRPWARPCPPFWLGIMLFLLFSVRLGWLPSSGRGDLEHLILPAITLGLFTTARITRLTRSGMLEVLGQDYIRTARAKGVGEPPVVWKHALRNASIPIVTIVGIELGTLLGGSVITETIFAWPGVGRLSVQAIFNRDYPVVQAAVFLLASTFVVVNFLVDIVYTYLDPRIRFR